MAAVLVTGLLAGCGPVTYPVDDGGVGLPAGTGIERTFSGITLKTFTAPLASVGTATLQSLNYMDIDLQEVRKDVQTWGISATAGRRVVEIYLEAVTPNTTLMRVMVNDGDPFVKDGATATEIVLQTADALGSRPRRAETAQTVEPPPAAARVRTHHRVKKGTPDD